MTHSKCNNTPAVRKLSGTMTCYKWWSYVWLHNLS